MISYLNFLNHDLRLSLSSYRRAYETEWIANPEYKTKLHIIELITNNETRLVKLRPYVDAEIWLSGFAAGLSGSCEMVDLIVTTSITRTACYRSIGGTGYTYLLKKDLSPLDVQIGFADLIHANYAERIKRVGTKLLDNRYINCWYFNLLEAPLPIIKMFKSHLGPYTSAVIVDTNAFMKFRDQVDARISYMYLDEDGLQMRLLAESSAYLVGEMILSDDTVESIIKKCIVSMCYGITKTSTTTDEQVKSRIVILGKYGIIEHRN